MSMQHESVSSCACSVIIVASVLTMQRHQGFCLVTAASLLTLACACSVIDVLCRLALHAVHKSRDIMYCLLVQLSFRLRSLLVSVKRVVQLLGGMCLVRFDGTDLWCPVLFSAHPVDLPSCAVVIAEVLANQATSAE